MLFYHRALFCLSLFAFGVFGKDDKYKANWDSLDSRPIPAWYDEAKIGIFIHWGVFSVPSFASEWFWINWHNNRSDIVSFMQKNYRPGFTYQEFASDFSAEFFDPVQWVKLFEEAGAEYVVLTSKHHEGYTLWPSKYSFSWNSADVGPHRDLVGELANATRKETKLHFGLYHSLFEWFHPLYQLDKRNNFSSQHFVVSKILPEMKELVNLYKPEVIWSDGEWEANDTYWLSKEFLAWLYNDSPVKDTVVVNDRWGSNTLCKHGGIMTCSDRYNPKKLKKRKWENALTIDSHSWGYRRNADLKDFLTTHNLIALVAQTVSCNGNILLNVGPTKEGVITPIYQERLLDLGKWLKVNGPAIYKSKPWTVCQNDTATPDVWYTTQKLQSGGLDLYAIVLNWPKKGVISLKCPLVSSSSNISMLGVSNPLKWNYTGNHVKIEFPDKSAVSTDWAWTLKITDLKNMVNEEYRVDMVLNTSEHRIP